MQKTPSAVDDPNRTFRIGLILSTSLGNLTRYRIMRKYADRIPGLRCVWAPVKHFYGVGEYDPVRYVPRPFYERAVVLAQSWPVLGCLKTFDAVMIHQLEAQPLALLRGGVFNGPVLFAAQDNPPMIDPDDFPFYPEQRAKSSFRQKLRLKAELAIARRTHYHICFSRWQARTLVEKCQIAESRVRCIHTGLDLEEWPDVPREAAAKRPQVLFVGGDFYRKGGDILLKIFSDGIGQMADLNIVTTTPLTGLPSYVNYYNELTPNSEELKKIFRLSEILVLPTTADFSPWVCLEAMANRLPVIASRVGGIPDMAQDGISGFTFDMGDHGKLASLLRGLIANPDLRKEIGARGRHLLESDFDASRNVPAMIYFMRRGVSEARSSGKAHLTP